MTVEINWDRFEELCGLQCTLREIAADFKCSEDTVEYKVKEHYGQGFSEVFKTKRTKGYVSLRRNLFELSKRKPIATVFLAKNLLGMSDKQEITGDITIRVVYDDSKEGDNA